MPPGATRCPGDQPLPGYTISNPTLAPLAVHGRSSRVLQGVHQHAAYDVEVPADWNGELVMWAHGYRGTGKVLTVDTPGYGLRQKLLDEGYAWAASSYATNDYNVATGVTTTRGLALLAADLLDRRPSRTYVAGVSMGGHVIGRSLEQYPRFYDGALPMCGVLGDQELFDYFLSYNLVAQDLADHEAYPPPSDYLSTRRPGDRAAARARRPAAGRRGHHQRPRQAAARDHHEPHRRGAPGGRPGASRTGRTSCSRCTRPTPAARCARTPAGSRRTPTRPTRRTPRST